MIYDSVYLLLVLVVIFMVYLRFTRNVAEGFTDKEGRIVSALLLSITLGNLINGVFHSSHYNSLFWLIIALMFASLHLTAKDKNFSFNRLLPSLK